MKTPATSGDRAHPLENALAWAVLGGFLYMGYRVITLGYFPQPFFWDLDDTFRDWFSTAVWAHDQGAYDNWLTVYPPLSFVFLKFAGLPSCYELTHDKLARQCDWLGIVILHAIFVLNIVLVALAFKKIDRKTALQRSFALSAGMPMLFGLERGNLILLCFTCVLLGYGPLVRSARLRWLFVGMALNFKVYLVAGVLVHLLKRRWLWVQGVALATAAVYVMSYMIYGEGTPMEVYTNLVNFGTGTKPGAVLDFWYSNTYNALQYVIVESDAPIYLFLSSGEVKLIAILVPLLVRSAQLIILVSAVATWLRPEVVPPYRVTFFGLALAMITTETSAYTQPILFLFIFMESWKGWARPAAIVCCYIMCIPGDIMLSPGLNGQFSYISDQYVYAQQGLVVGMFLRPLFLLLPCYFLGLMTIRDVWRDIRFQGWKDRWRFRHDLPLLPGVIRPQPPRSTLPEKTPS